MGFPRIKQLIAGFYTWSSKFNISIIHMEFVEIGAGYFYGHFGFLSPVIILLSPHTRL